MKYIIVFLLIALILGVIVGFELGFKIEPKECDKNLVKDIVYETKIKYVKENCSCPVCPNPLTEATKQIAEYERNKKLLKKVLN